jgi:hypothetical protein
MVSLCRTEKSVVKLKPPLITPQTICKEVICTRPVREGSFNISLSSVEKKVVVHCFGHGGSGWTTLFGSVAKAISLLEEEKLAKRHPIRIIGAGCIGLAMAVELVRKGYHIEGISAENLYNIASWKAGGYFALVSLKNSPEEQKKCVQLGLETFEAFQSVAQGKHPYLPQNCVKYMPDYSRIGTPTGLEDLQASGLLPSSREVVVDFGNGVRHEHFLESMTYYIDTTEIMKHLWVEIEKYKIPVEVKKVEAFDQIEEEVIFNCSGLGAQRLNHDSKMMSVRGHLILFNELSGDGHLNYMIYDKVVQDGNPERIYMFPKMSAVNENGKEFTCRGVLGGTFIEGVEKLSKDELEALDRREFQKMLDRTSLLFYGAEALTAR